MDSYELTCEATVNGEVFQVRMTVTREVYLDPYARRHAENRLRMDLAAEIGEKFSTKISARRVSDPFGRAE